MSYHQLFPDPPRTPSAPGRHRQEAADPAWDFEPQPWDRPQAEQPDRADDDHSRELQSLGSAYRRLRRVSTLAALGYFVLFLLLSAYAPGTMAGEAGGGLTTGLLLGLLQLPVALAAIALYERIARRRVDPLASSIRERAEQAAEQTAPPRTRGGWQSAGGARA
ncbi:DUF485 domain-containing protein [Streptomyces xantholiticus]|uniref:DUF485 domain-containing protein n=1 Tax=Streptomyces xantholiticus TaxID=68285 RepID=UPI001673BDBA|nr:DUF485 domain-containing protein [Streptomyces xantholiticus]GGW42318.1 hypothetical protein GCM10010381_29210 [Streptomyces xantholiticus]